MPSVDVVLLKPKRRQERTQSGGRQTRRSSPRIWRAVLPSPFFARWCVSVRASSLRGPMASTRGHVRDRGALGSTSTLLRSVALVAVARFDGLLRFPGRSTLCARPTSSDSLNRPVAVRFTYRPSVPVLMRSRFWVDRFVADFAVFFAIWPSRWQRCSAGIIVPVSLRGRCVQQGVFRTRERCRIG